MPIKIRSGTFNTVEGSFTLDLILRETNFESNNIYVTDAFNNYGKCFKLILIEGRLMTLLSCWGQWDGRDAFYNCRNVHVLNKNWQQASNFSPDGQRREDYTRPPLSQPQFQSMPHQTSSARSRVTNHHVNITNTQIYDSFNDSDSDNSETHCKHESIQHTSRFLKSVQMMDLRLPPTKESSLKVSQYIKKI